MKYLLTLFCSVTILWAPGLGYAGIKEDYEQAYKLYVAAGACMAAYSDRYGGLVNRYLEQDGWKIDHYNQTKGSADARFLLAKNQFDDGQQMYVLAIVGTENAKDMKIDLKVDKVYFAGSSLEEFAANAAKDEIASTEPKVHRGFHEFVQAGLTAKTLGAKGEPQFLTDLLLANKERKIYLVGHSLGGAAATLAGARLVSMGVSPQQIEIITFGAPAVGNAAFANEFAPVLNLTRVVLSGDPVTGVLQTLVGGYEQFGRKIQWESSGVGGQTHKLTEYADLAIKNYYDKRQLALQAGVAKMPRGVANGESGVLTYIAPLKNSLPDSLAKEFWYMQQALWDEYRDMLPGYIPAGETATNNLRKKARATGCKWLVVPEVSGYRLKQERSVYYIAFTQTVYDVATGAVVKTASFSTATYNLTALEAFIHDVRGLNSSQIDWWNRSAM